MRVLVQSDPFDAAALLSGFGAGAGAIVTFTGLVRGDGLDDVKARVVEDGENRRRLHARLLDALKDARDPWETSREGNAIKQFIPIKVEA